jgi:1,4-dihydroxy-2-naphthoate octaprenyltransferase
VLVLQAAYGIAAAHHLGHLSALRVVLSLALFVPDGIGRRLINDYEDYARGLDKPDRVRPDSALARGLDMRRVRHIGLAAFAVAWVCVGYLAMTTNPWIMLLAFIAYVAYFSYAGGPRPLGHMGLGEVIDFVVTGTTVTLLVIWVNAGHLDLAACIVAAGPGFLFATLMLHNNARDLEKDRAAGKITLPHLISSRQTKTVYAMCVVGFYLTVIGFALLTESPGCLLPLLTAPWAGKLILTVTRSQLGETLVSWSRVYYLMIADFALFTVGACL